jgi:hypothetical protein
MVKRRVDYVSKPTKDWLNLGLCRVRRDNKRSEKMYLTISEADRIFYGSGFKASDDHDLGLRSSSFASDSNSQRVNLPSWAYGAALGDNKCTPSLS